MVKARKRFQRQRGQDNKSWFKKIYFKEKIKIKVRIIKKFSKNFIRNPKTSIN